MNIIKRFSAALLTAALLICSACTMSGCGNNKLEVAYDDILQEKGKISASPYSAEYNKDGKLTLVVAVQNGTEYTKILKKIIVSSLKNAKGFDIVEESTFDLDDKKYLEPNKNSFYECVFEAEQVKANVKLDTLESKITLDYVGCVKTDKVPETSNEEGFAVSVMEGEINETGGFEGKICIRNNYKTDKTPSEIYFDIYDDRGRKLNTSVIHKVNNNVTIQSGKMVTQKVDIPVDYVNSAISQNVDFNTLYVKNFKVQ